MRSPKELLSDRNRDHCRKNDDTDSRSICPSVLCDLDLCLDKKAPEIAHNPEMIHSKRVTYPDIAKRRTYTKKRYENSEAHQSSYVLQLVLGRRKMDYISPTCTPSLLQRAVKHL